VALAGIYRAREEIERARSRDELSDRDRRLPGGKSSGVAEQPTEPVVRGTGADRGRDLRAGEDRVLPRQARTAFALRRFAAGGRAAANCLRVTRAGSRSAARTGWRPGGGDPVDRSRRDEKPPSPARNFELNNIDRRGTGSHRSTCWSYSAVEQKAFDLISPRPAGVAKSRSRCAGMRLRVAATGGPERPGPGRHSWRRRPAPARSGGGFLGRGREALEERTPI